MIKFLDKLFSVMSGVSLVAVFAIAFMQVVQRYIFQISIQWAPDAIRILFVYSVFTGMCVGVLRKSHLNIDVLIHLLPERGRVIIRAVSNILVIIFLSFVFKESFPFIAANRDQMMPYLQYPMSYVYGVFPVCVAVMLFYLIYDTMPAIWHLICGKRGAKA
ncbi:MAG: TRAP transporter small permease [Synergistaceae bacterium]|nr:TRAP transporter small permease [Synergistaceae bacterium]